jgi:hypothetical protein
MSKFQFVEPKNGHRLPHDPFKGLINGVGRMCPNVAPWQGFLVGRVWNPAGPCITLRHAGLPADVG